MRLRPAAAILVLALAGVVPAEEAKSPPVAYPTGYRQWTHVKSMVIHSDKNPLYSQFGGIHHVYVSPDGVRAMTKGGSFPDGTVLVFDLLEAKEDNGAYVEGPRKLLAVMVKERGKYKATGGWGFDAFKGDSRTERTVSDPFEQCFGCHQEQKDNDFVFSGYRP
jgi:hypothetical protein